MRTSSGDVYGTLTGVGNVDIETGSSGVRLSGLRHGMMAVSQSGHDGGGTSRAYDGFVIGTLTSTA